MQELIEAGYVYIAKPPLYKLKQGRQERYIEKESELEEILLGDKFERFEVTDRAGTAVQAHRDALAALLPAAQAVRGLGVARCAPSTATTSSRSSRSRRSSTSRSPTVDDARSSCSRARTPDGEPYTTELVERRRRARRVKAVERKTDLARTHRAAPRRCSRRTSTASSSRVHAELVELAGTPPFTVALGDETRRGAVVRGAAPRGHGRRRARASRSSASRASAR